MRFVGGIIVGFLGATVITGVLSFVGLNDPAMIGLLHIVLWLVFAIGIVKKTTKTDGTDSMSTRPLNDHAESLGDQGSASEKSSPVDPLKIESTAATATEPAVAEHESSAQKRSWLNVATVVVSSVLLLGVVALSGFLGAKYAVDQAAATATTLDVIDIAGTDPEGWDDLTNTEKTWCKRDSDTWFAMLRAAEILDFYDFSTNLFDVRDGDVDVGDDLLSDLNRWLNEKGEDEYDREIAIACRAAFSGR